MALRYHLPKSSVDVILNPLFASSALTVAPHSLSKSIEVGTYCGVAEELSFGIY